jgi:hypothetical protein
MLFLRVNSLRSQMEKMSDSTNLSSIFNYLDNPPKSNKSIGNQDIKLQRNQRKMTQRSQKWTKIFWNIYIVLQLEQLEQLEQVE